MMKAYFFIFIMLVSSQTQAELYKWTDAKGKVHFSDKPAHNQKHQVHKSKPINIDNSKAETEKLRQVFHQESTSEKRYKKQQQTKQGKVQLEKKNACNKARYQLQTLQGRVIFTDGKGKEIKVSEAERRQRAENFSQAIKRHCN